MSRPEDLAAATAKIAARMIRLDDCPGCGGRAFAATPCGNDLDDIEGVDANLRDSDYHLCRECSLLFARRRQPVGTAVDFYGLFVELERRSYAVYPPPESYRQAKKGAAAGLLARMEGHGLLRPGQKIAHLRSDVGSLEEMITAKYPDSVVDAWDYFDSNIRYADEHGPAGTRRLEPTGLELAEGAGYDLVVSNHIFTHSLIPQTDLKNLRAAVGVGGMLYAYNEADHLFRFQPGDPRYQWVALNNFHKQLFTSLSLRFFLLRGGFEVLSLDHRAHFMELVARAVDPADADFADRLDRARRLAADSEPAFAAKFEKWSRVQNSPLRDVYKIASRLKRRLSGSI